MGRFETEILTQPKNMDLLKNLSGQWVDKVRQRKPLKQIILDMDSSVSPTYGNQEGTAYNGYFSMHLLSPAVLSISKQSTDFSAKAVYFVAESIGTMAKSVYFTTK